MTSLDGSQTSQFCFVTRWTVSSRIGQWWHYSLAGMVVGGEDFFKRFISNDVGDGEQSTQHLDRYNVIRSTMRADGFVVVLRSLRDLLNCVYGDIHKVDVTCVGVCVVTMTRRMALLSEGDTVGGWARDEFVYV
ncbi:hypothetical protein Tco_1013147, partial [Tanacetum coccineum]